MSHQFLNYFLIHPRVAISSFHSTRGLFKPALRLASPISPSILPPVRARSMPECRASSLKVFIVQLISSYPQKLPSGDFTQCDEEGDDGYSVNVDDEGCVAKDDPFPQSRWHLLCAFLGRCRTSEKALHATQTPPITGTHNPSRPFFSD